MILISLVHLQWPPQLTREVFVDHEDSCACLGRTTGNNGRSVTARTHCLAHLYTTIAWNLLQNRSSQLACISVMWYMCASCSHKDMELFGQEAWRLQVWSVISPGHA